MGDHKKRLHAAILGGMIVITLAGASPSAHGDSICVHTSCQMVIRSGDNQNVPVKEGQGGNLSWIIQNMGDLTITLDNTIRNLAPAFSYTGGDMDDRPTVRGINGCDTDVMLVSNGGQCVLTVSFITPDDQEPIIPDENNDRGFWDLLQRGNQFPGLGGTDTQGVRQFSELLRGHVEVDDPGVSAITPEPSSLVLFGIGVLGIGLASWRKARCCRPPLGSCRLLTDADRKAEGLLLSRRREAVR